jgi:tellurite methyltransferase
MKNLYDERYNQKDYYWGKIPSKICYRILDLMPPDRPLTLLDIGCGEGRNAVFFARNGYKVTAFDLSPKGVEKTKRMALEAGVPIDVFQADLNEYRLDKHYDILFSGGVLHYIAQELRKEIFDNYKSHTSNNGLNVFSVFVKKPFIEKAPDSESTAHKYKSGELFTYYHDWKIEYCTEDIFDCMSSGVPHKHCIDRMIARKMQWHREN